MAFGLLRNQLIYVGREIDKQLVTIIQNCTSAICLIGMSPSLTKKEVDPSVPYSLRTINS